MKQNLILILLIFFYSYSFSQENTQSGKIIYGVKPEDNFYIALEQFEKEEQDFLVRLYKNAEQELPFVEFQLLFNEKEALFKSKERMESDGARQFDAANIFTGGNQIIYYNLTKWQRLVQKELPGSGITYLIHEKMKPLKWEIQPETKVIQGFICHKAIYNEYWSDELLQTLDDLSEQEKEDKKTTYTAWFAPDLAFQIGPGNVYGLPGIILELSGGDDVVFYAKKIDLKAKVLSVEKPTKGKQVTEEEYNSLRSKMWDLMKD